MPGLGAILGNIGVPLANTVAAHNFAQKVEEDKQRQIVMQSLAQQRQDRLDAENSRYKQIQEDYLNRGRQGNGVTYRADDQGNLMQLPTTAAASGPTDRVPPPTITQQGPSAPPVAGLNAPTVPRATPGPLNGPTPPQIGTSTGIKVAVKPPVVPKVPITPLADKLQTRVSALVAGGMPLSKASEQARLEFGQQNTPAPASFTFNPSGVDSQGNPVFAKGNTRTGELTPTTVGSKTAAVSATNQAASARLQAAVSEMNNADPSMSAYEAKLANKTANINGLQQFMGSVGSVFTKDDPEAIAKQTAALTVLNNTNPELARYIRRGLSFAEGESMITQRPSDFRTRMAAFLSTAPTGASPEMIQDIQSRRHSILTPLNSVVTPGGGRGGSNPNVSHVTPAERAELKKQGFTDAQIDAIRP